MELKCLSPQGGCPEAKKLNIEFKAKSGRSHRGAPGLLFANNNHYLCRRGVISTQAGVKITM